MSDFKLTDEQKKIVKKANESAMEAAKSGRYAPQELVDRMTNEQLSCVVIEKDSSNSDKDK